MGEIAYRRSSSRIAVGILISLLLHVAAIVLLRLPAPRQTIDPRSWLTQVDVRILPPPPAPAPTVQRAPQPTAAAETRRRQPRIVQRKRTPTAQTGLAVQAAHESTLMLAPADHNPAPHFDREAAKATARDIAGELDTSQPKLRETRDEKLARKIQSAARPNCKDGIPGGLLAPLYLLMEKKDSGCKW